MVEDEDEGKAKCNNSKNVKGPDTSPEMEL